MIEVFYCDGFSKNDWDNDVLNALFSFSNVNKTIIATRGPKNHFRRLVIVTVKILTSIGRMKSGPNVRLESHMIDTKWSLLLEGMFPKLRVNCRDDALKNIILLPEEGKFWSWPYL